MIRKVFLGETLWLLKLLVEGIMMLSFWSELLAGFVSGAVVAGFKKLFAWIGSLLEVGDGSSGWLNSLFPSCTSR